MRSYPGGTGYGLVSHLVRFCQALRESGLVVGPSETADAARSLGLIDILDRDQVYWALKTVLVSRVSETAAFDDCFARFWTLAALRPIAPRSSPQPTLAGGVSPIFGGARILPEPGEPQETRQTPVVYTGASPVEVVARRDVTGIHGKDLEKVSEIASRIVRALPQRLGRRWRRHRRKGVPDLRGALRLSLAHGGDLMTLPRRRRVPKTPRLLVLLDISGSMDPHVEMLLQLVYGMGQKTTHVETFAFSTSLTRVTRQLKAHSFSEGLSRLSGLVRQWSGGTRIGDCLEPLNRKYAALLDRDTTVLLISDGWETGDPLHLTRQVALIRARVRRLVWLNPLIGTPDYAPLTQGLQAVSPHVDLFASALDLAHLRRLPRLLRR